MASTKTKKNALLDKVRAYIERFVAFENPYHSTVLALWVIHTHAFDTAYATPYLYITSAGPESGKTRTIEVARSISRNTRMVADLTASSMFRVIEANRPTLFIDEVDTVYSGRANEELRSVLNSGYQHNGTTMRSVPSKADDPEGGVREFSTFCPKLLAGIDNGQVPDTILSRCIRIELRRAKGEKRDKLERFVMRKVEPQADELRHEIHTWAAHNLDKLADLEVAPIEEIGDRAWDIAEPLIQIATVLGVQDEARKAVTALLAGERAELTPGLQVLQTARELFDEADANRVTVAMLAEACDIPAGRVGRLLSPYGIKSTAIRFTAGMVAKGYYRADFIDAWERYLPE